LADHGRRVPSPSSPLIGEQRFTEYSHTYSGLSGSIGTSFQANSDLTFKVNISRGFRAPNIFEISANGVHPGTNIYQIGNPDFKPEFSLQEDFGIYFRHGHFNGSLELFNTDISNYIFNQKLLNHLGGDSIQPGVVAFLTWGGISDLKCCFHFEKLTDRYSKKTKFEYLISFLKFIPFIGTLFTILLKGLDLSILRAGASPAPTICDLTWYVGAGLAPALK
jgi:outer membrane receptor protein involved in Fe transport